MKNKKTNVGSFATAKLKVKRQSLLTLKLRSILAIIAIVAVIGFSFAACSDDDDSSSSNGSGSSGGSWDAGKSLKGTSWEQKETSGTPGSSMFSSDYTYTMTFTSDDMLTITTVGWSEIRESHVDRNYNITYTSNRTPVNKTYNGTYTYFTNTKEGFMNSDFWSINPWNFRILSDNRTMAGKLDTKQFTRK